MMSLAGSWTASFAYGATWNHNAELWSGKPRYQSDDLEITSRHFYPLGWILAARIWKTEPKYLFPGPPQFYPSLHIDLAGETIFCYIPIRTQFTPETDELELAGLILRPSGKSKGLFRRCGVLMTGEADEMRLLMRWTVGIPHPFYEELVGKGDYTIHVV